MAPHCKSCGSSRLLQLNGETCLHFPGLSGINKSPIFSFGKLTVCLDCGAMDSLIAPKELKLVREYAADAQNLADQSGHSGPASGPDPFGDMPRPTKRLP
jgi:hypothetical protein